MASEKGRKLTYHHKVRWTADEEAKLAKEVVGLLRGHMANATDLALLMVAQGNVLPPDRQRAIGPFQVRQGKANPQSTLYRLCRVMERCRAGVENPEVEPEPEPAAVVAVEAPATPPSVVAVAVGGELERLVEYARRIADALEEIATHPARAKREVVTPKQDATLVEVVAEATSESAAPAPSVEEAGRDDEAEAEVAPPPPPRMARVALLGLLPDQARFVIDAFKGQLDIRYVPSHHTTNRRITLPDSVDWVVVNTKFVSHSTFEQVYSKFPRNRVVLVAGGITAVKGAIQRDLVEAA